MEKSKSYSSGYSVAYHELYNARSGFEDRSKSYSFNGPSNNAVGNWDATGNPELKRRRRVASYNMYTVEEKLKSSLRSSFKWIKSKFVDGLYDM
ncbi:hypothetical protein MLD38_012193 [Melastoma candidum]|uniref:Uncharacterized protein n=1 Tax=Melastoma candidum TaxID=119954 RepID=A0ACB9R6N2_9MYRT|nr:hypothetical protein MLD38_012193 [Melastoma candidum]